MLSSDPGLLRDVAGVCPGISEQAGAIPGHSRVLSACLACRMRVLRLCSLREHLGGLCGCCGAVGPSLPPAAVSGSRWGEQDWHRQWGALLEQGGVECQDCAPSPGALALHVCLQAQLGMCRDLMVP